VLKLHRWHRVFCEGLPPMPHVHLSLLGGFECRRATGELLRFPTRKVRALLAYLAASAGQPHRRDRLAGLLWGDRDEPQARANLRKAVSRLRASLPEEARNCVAADVNQVVLRPDGLEVDVPLFERCAADGTPEALERAALLYRGAFLADLAECGEEFDAWLMPERRRLDEVLREILQRLLEQYVVTGAIDRAIQVALRLLTHDPLQESTHRALIRLYMYQDRIGSALDQYRRCRKLLADELGIEPAAETERLRAELLKLVPEGEREPDPEGDDVPERPAVFQAAAADRARRRAELAARPSIVVLSFVGKEGEPSYRYLGDGLAEDIATEVGRFRELDVIAPTTALAYRDAAIAPEQVGRELGAAYVLEGRLRPRGESLRATVRLVESATGRQLWAERYDWREAQIFAMQDEVVRRIVSTLVGQIEEARLEATRRKRPDDLAAYDLWLRGWGALKRSELPAIGEARRYFQQAVAKDPRFARAYVGLALAHLNEWACFTWNHWVFPRQEVLDLARRAVELDDRDHRAHCILGMTQLYAHDYAAAHWQLSRAVELNPNDADVLAHVAVGMALIGEHALAVEAGRSALRLAPHHPEWHAAFAGEALFAAGLYEEAIVTLAPAPEALCNTPAFIAASYAHLGQTEHCFAHRDTVHRHHGRQQARGFFPEGMSCIEWLLAMDPFQQPADVAHYLDGLRKAGFA
jgi:DNA-binding SARP family transcriptional activator